MSQYTIDVPPRKKENFFGITKGPWRQGKTRTIPHIDDVADYSKMRVVPKISKGRQSANKFVGTVHNNRNQHGYIHINDINDSKYRTRTTSSQDPMQNYNTKRREKGLRNRIGRRITATTGGTISPLF